MILKKKREFWEKSENSEEKVKILREKNSQIKVRIQRKENSEEKSHKSES